MRRGDRPGRAIRPDLPTGDVPSAEVLDELLRAFAADADGGRSLQHIDLTSPEVEALLAGTPPGERRPATETRPEREPAGGTAHPAQEARPADRLPPDAPPEVDDERVETVDARADQADADAAADAVADAVADEEADEATDAVADEATDAVADAADRVGTPAPAASETDDGVTAGGATEDDGGDVEEGDDPSGESPTAPRTIVIDASDDPPDAVYLAAGDPLLAKSAGSRDGGVVTTDPDRVVDGPLFIDDAAIATGETISVADASTATRIEPRMRERRIAVKRAAGRRRLRWVGIVAAVLAVVVGALAVLGSSLFAIDSVDVEGADRADGSALQAVIDELEGTAVLRADTDRAEEQLEAIPWVASARVTTQFPDAATIELRERTPLATYQGADGRFRLFDVDGRVLEVLDAHPAEHLLVVMPDAPDLDAGRFGPQGLVAAANLIQALTPELRAVAQSVSVTPDATDLRMALTDGREVRFGPGRDLVAKLVRLQTRLELVDAGGFRYVDVSTNEVTAG